MRVLLVSSSARGHALGEAILRSRHRPELISVCATNNPGLRRIAEVMQVTDVMDFTAILAVAKKTKPHLAVIGPDDPIGGGLADQLEAAGFPTMAPYKALARIESSKGFTRDLLAKHGVDASPRYKVFIAADEKPIRTFIEELGGDFVVKYDGLRGGKGVKVSGEHLATIDEGIAYAQDCIREGGRVVIEEKLIGVEFSLLSFVSGTKVIDMPAVQDHKRAFPGDTGPNTGGMGTYTDVNHSLPFLTKEDLARASEINQLTAQALLRECGQPYRGILYGGFIAVRDGIRVIEYNARFGDPEALNLLPLLETDFVDICQAITQEKLSQDLVHFSKQATVCKYITPIGYPNNKDQRGEVVTFPAIPQNARLYFGDISEDKKGALHLGGSRTAGLVGMGATIAEAEAIAEKLCEQVQGPVRFRKDIGTADLVHQRIDHMKRLRQ